MFKASAIARRSWFTYYQAWPGAARCLKFVNIHNTVSSSWMSPEVVNNRFESFQRYFLILSKKWITFPPCADLYFARQQIFPYHQSVAKIISSNTWTPALLASSAWQSSSLVAVQYVKIAERFLLWPTRVGVCEAVLFLGRGIFLSDVSFVKWIPALVIQLGEKKNKNIWCKPVEFSTALRQDMKIVNTRWW